MDIAQRIGVIDRHGKDGFWGRCGGEDIQRQRCAAHCSFFFVMVDMTAGREAGFFLEAARNFPGYMCIRPIGQQGDMTISAGACTHLPADLPVIKADIIITLKGTLFGKEHFAWHKAGLLVGVFSAGQGADDGDARCQSRTDFHGERFFTFFAAVVQV